MRHWTSWLAPVLLVVLGLIFTSSCGKEGSATGKATKESYVGRWNGTTENGTVELTFDKEKDGCLISAVQTIKGTSQKNISSTWAPCEFDPSSGSMRFNKESAASLQSDGSLLVKFRNANLQFEGKLHRGKE